MRRRRGLLVVAVCLAAIGVVMALLHRDQEPAYKGRSLSQWVDDSYTTVASQYIAAEHAVQTIGTNALPVTLKWIRHEPTPWVEALLRALPAAIRDRDAVRAALGRGVGRADNAVRVFAILGTNAHTAIPELQSLMRDKGHPNTAKRAIEALSCIGPAAFPYLAAALADTNQPFRDEIATFIGINMASDVGTNACLITLRAALSDPDLATRDIASAMVKMLTVPPVTNAPSQ